MESPVIPNLCHVCGADVESARVWLYQREGVFQPLEARCEACSLRDRINDAEAAIAEMYRNLCLNYRRLLALQEGRKPL